MAITYKLFKKIGSSTDSSVNQYQDGVFKKSIPFDSGNIDYQKFLADVKEHGVSIVEGSTVGVTTAYDIARAAEYPSLEEQQDMQYWDAVNGTTTWKDKIAAIKAKYPKTQVGVTTIGSLPDWIVDLSTS